MWSNSQLKFVARLRYGDPLPRDTAKGGRFSVYGSNGPFASSSRANTAAPAIVIGRKGSYGKVNWSDDPCFASDTTFCVDESDTRHDLRWLYWLLQTLRLDEGTDETAVPGLNRDFAHSRRVLVPSPGHQRAIAAYLDRETARLDALIAEEESVLNLVAEKRDALFTHAVTRGLDSGDTLRESDAVWIGPIPESWITVRAKWLFEERDERSDSGKEELLTVSHLTGVTPRSEKDVKMFEASTMKGYKICRHGDLVINTLWAWMGAMGVARCDGIVSPSYNVYSPVEKLDSRYLDALVRLPIFAQEVARHSKGVWSSRMRLYPEAFFSMSIPVPPLALQRGIMSHLSEETRKLDELRAVAERMVGLLRERRETLITAAVTGRIRVESAA